MINLFKKFVNMFSIHKNINNKCIAFGLEFSINWNMKFSIQLYITFLFWRFDVDSYDFKILGDKLK